MELYLHKNGEQVGPFTEEQISSMINDGSLSRDDITWHEGLTEWQPLHTVFDITSIAEEPTSDYNSVVQSRPVNSNQQEVQKFASEQVANPSESLSINLFDKNQVISTWIASGGLLVVAFSPFFKWVAIGAGGVTGIAGDGRILLAITLLVSAAFAAAIVKNKFFIPVLLSVTSWGIITTFWMGSLIWKLGSLFDAQEVKDNPFAAIFSSILVSPGAGLYLGLIGGIVVAAAAGFIAVRRLLLLGNIKLFYLSQGIACLIGILLAVFVGPGRTPASNDTSYEFPFSSQAEEKEDIVNAQLGESFLLGNLEITPTSIHLETLSEEPMFGDPKPRKSKSYVLTFIAKNKSEGQVFSAYSSSSVTDNFGNECLNPMSSSSMLRTKIDGNEYLKDISPGEFANVMVAFDPALESAKDYTWTISTQISNQEKYEKWRIRFSPKDIPVE